MSWRKGSWSWKSVMPIRTGCLKNSTRLLIESNQRLDALERENRALREMLTILAPVLTESPDE